MTGRKLFMFVAAIFLLLLGLAGFYRLMFGFPISLGGHALGQTSSFFVFVVCVALSVVLFRESKTAT